MTLNQKDTFRRALFIICPFCGLEPYLRLHFGEEAYFMTLPAADCDLKEEEQDILEVILKQEKINHIVIVQEMDCHFLSEALAGKMPFGFKTEQKLRRIIEENKVFVQHAINSDLPSVQPVYKLLCQHLDKVREQVYRFVYGKNLETRISGLIVDKKRGAYDLY